MTRHLPLIAVLIVAVTMAGCRGKEPTLAQLRGAARGDPESVEKLVALGEAELAEKLHHDAYVSLKRAYDLDQNSYQAAFGLARAYKELGDAESAMVSIKRALHLRPEQAEAYELQGELYMLLGEAPKAAQKFTKAIELRSDAALALHTLPLAYLVQGKVAEADTAARKAVQVLPDDLEARMNLALVLVRRKNHNEAEAQLRKAMAMAPEDPRPYLRLADLLLATERNLPEARELAQKATGIDAGDGHGELIAALVLRKLDRREDAATELQAAVRAHPTNQRIWLALAGVLKELGREEAASKAVAAAMQIGPRPSAPSSAQPAPGAGAAE